MRGVARPFAMPPTLASERSVFDVVEAVGAVRRSLKHMLCTVLHGGHELYRARTDTKLYQQCLLCGYETHGWVLEARPRLRRHLSAPLRRHNARWSLSQRRSA